MGSLLGNSREPDIYFRESGHIDIPPRISSEIGLEVGDVIDIWEEDDEYFLYVKHKAADLKGKHQAVCRKLCSKSKWIRAGSKKLADAMIRLVDAKEANFPCGDIVMLHDNLPAIPIITKKNLYDKRD